MSAKPNISADQLPNYTAFISYSHKDDRPAQRLHRRLERYRIPEGLQKGQSTLGRIFRDKVELSASSGLDKSIKAALRASKNLIVLCSPNAAASRWVNEEVIYFKSLGRADRIFTIIVSGEPFAQDAGFDQDTECLPHALRFDTGPDGQVGDKRREPLAADFRRGRDGERLGTLKLVAGLLGVRLDALLQRQLVRARNRLMGLAASAVITFTLLTSLTWTAYSAQKQAEARRADAENFVEFLLSDLSQQLEGYGRLDLLDAVGEKAIGYYTQFDAQDLDAKANGRRARTLHFMGELQIALGETEAAEAYFRQSYDITKVGLDINLYDPDRVFEHARSAYMRSLPLRKRADYAGELEWLEEYAKLSAQLYTIESRSKRSVLQLALAKTNMGRVKLRSGNIKDAGSNFKAAADLYAQIDSTAMEAQSWLALTDNMAWHAQSYLVAGDNNTSYNIRAAQVEVLKTQLALAPHDSRLKDGLVYAQLGLGNAAANLSRFEEADKILRQALLDAQAALRLEPGREKMRRAKSAILHALMNIATNTADAEHYKAWRTELISLQNQPMTASVQENKYWDEVMPAILAGLDAAFEAQILQEKSKP